MTTIYEEHVMDHYKHPRNSGTISHPTIQFHDTNPLCGDEITLTLRVEKDKITAAKFVAKGCAISQAGASMLFEQLEGKTVREAIALDKQVILDEFGTALSVSRVKCALLALSAVKKSLAANGARETEI